MKTVIGSLYNPNHKTKGWKLFEDMSRRLGYNDFEYVAYGTKHPNTVIKLKKFLLNPPRDKLAKLYKETNIWLALSTLEGFYNVPAEAALNGCLIVAINGSLNGTQDYCNNETAMMFDNIEQAVESIRNPDYTKVAKMKEVLINKIGNRKKNMKIFIERLVQ